MKIIETYEVIDATGESVEWVKLQRAEDEFTWMSKAEYDRLEAEHFTPSVTNGD
jgi:hypothetical protein